MLSIRSTPLPDEEKRKGLYKALAPVSKFDLGPRIPLIQLGIISLTGAQQPNPWFMINIHTKQIENKSRKSLCVSS